MTIDRQYGKVVLVCDQQNSARCDETIETGKADFGEALAAAKREGWTVHALRPGPGFVHCCPRCTVPR